MRWVLVAWLTVPGDSIRFTEMCDASAAVCLSSGDLLIANDEDNILRLYRSTGGKPICELPLEDFLSQKKEADLEGGAELDGLHYWIGSHGRDRKGKLAPARAVLFATEERGKQIQPVGSPARSLLEAICNEPRHRELGLREAVDRPPGAGGLNIEGIGPAPNHGLWIGLRAPLADRRAIVLRLNDPLEVIEGKPPEFGDPILLPLEGLGIRDMSAHYLIAGPSEDNASSFRVYHHNLSQLDPGRMPELRLVRELDDFQAEAIVEYADGRLLVLADEGTKLIVGTPCKSAQPERQGFDGRWIDLRDPTSGVNTP